jgi:hypothetical protein
MAWLRYRLKNEPAQCLTHHAKQVQHVEPQEDRIFLASICANIWTSDVGVFGLADVKKDFVEAVFLYNILNKFCKPTELVT